ncbi:hypothetical protein CWR48_04910 [Oceanobacillus arenosus]|uniref:Uncharacterized protein n=1 Tax=Oceanobacillus arenosus TaxID=1229153 RepID=A0A3D8PX04_9BACI|nr:hypothetical protein [Oceanobacillus arenosus]RDW20067.1 hypothetical protein CWR48_04910 [Oceanobacillus arenosus]
MKNNLSIYNIVVHVVNLVILGAIGILAFFFVVNISPNKTPTSDMVAIISIVFLTVVWAINYWLQFKKRKWFVPIAGTVLFVVIAYLYLDVGIPFFYDVFIR